MNSFLLSLVISYVVSRLKLLKMSWYRNMKLFWTNMKLVMNKYLYSWNEYLPVFDSYSNYIMLSEIIKYIYCCNLNPISFEVYIFFYSNIMCNINAFVNIISFNRLTWLWGIDCIYIFNCIKCMTYFNSVDCVYFK